MTGLGVGFTLREPQGTASRYAWTGLKQGITRSEMGGLDFSIQFRLGEITRSDG